MQPAPIRSLAGSPGARAAALAAIAATVMVVYARAAGHAFVAFDDPGYVYENPIVKEGLSWANVRWAFTTFHLSNWHPLTWLSYLLDVTLFGPNPGAMLVENALLHAVNACLVALALERLTGARWRSLAVATLFALHPTRVESVAWVSERKDVLSTLFGLLALLAYASYARRPTVARWAAVAAAFAASLLAKPMLVTLPFLLLLLDVWPLRRVQPWATAAQGAAPPVRWGRAVLEKVPLLLLSAGCAVVNVAAQSSWGSVRDLPLMERLGNALVAYPRYLALLAWPIDLAVFYPLPASGYPAWQVAAAAALLLAASLGAARLASRAPHLALGWAWFLGTLVPVIGILQVGGQSIADRYTYFPAIGLFVALVWSAEALSGRLRPWLAPAAGLVLVALAAASFRQVGVWSDNTTLFTHALAVTGPTAKAHVSLAAGYREQGDLPRALEHAREATRLDPSDERSWLARAVTALGLGDEGEAEVALQGALAADPRYEQAFRVLAGLRTSQGRPEEAAAALRSFVALVPDEAAAWSELAAVLHRLGRLDEAVAAQRTAAETAGRDPGAWRDLGVLLTMKGDWPGAASALARAAGLVEDPALLGLLAEAQLRSGNRAGALSTSRRLAPHDPALAEQIRAAAAIP